MIRDEMNDRLKALGPTAIGVVQQVLLSDHAPPQVRLQAARDVLDRLGWVPPKRPEPVAPSAPKALEELSRAELESMVSGSRYHRLTTDALKEKADLLLSAPA
jgi:hypothetical protein